MIYTRAAALACLTAAFIPASAGAFEIEHTSARYHERQYQFELVAVLDAPPEKVIAVLLDYERYPALERRILEAKVLERPAERVAILSTTLHVCFGPFCRNVRRVERVEEAPFALAAFTDPARSDVRFGETHTMLAPAGEGTRVTYRSAVTPDFWLPPFIRRRWMLNTLSEASLDLFRSVEARAASDHE